MLLTLPTDYVTLRDEVIIPTLLELPCKMTSDKVTAQMLLTAKQESGLTTRYQVGSGIARGLWQMEKPTVNLIMLNKNSAQYLHTSEPASELVKPIEILLIEDNPGDVRLT